MSLYRDLVADGGAAEREAVRVQRRGDRAVLTLVEPERLNALSAPVVQQLKGALTELAGEPEVRSVVGMLGRA